jgi:hypothetical protein
MQYNPVEIVTLQCLVVVGLEKIIQTVVVVMMVVDLCMLQGRTYIYCRQMSGDSRADENSMCCCGDDGGGE